MQGLIAIVGLTLKAAIRYRVVVVLSVLLLASVVVLPLMIKHDGSAQGFTQILLTYTLSAITFLLGFSTLWIACGSLAREVQECQIQILAVKPIPRWKIWIGKWIGIVVINAILLGLSSLAVYGITVWRAQQLSEAQQAVLDNEIFVARGSALPEYPDIQPYVDEYMAERLKENPNLVDLDQTYVRQQVEEQVKAAQQVVRPAYIRRWTIPVASPESVKDQPMFLRVKFFTSRPYDTSTYNVMWEIGPPETPQRVQRSMDIAPESPIEFLIPPNLLDPEGNLIVDVYNDNQEALLFPLEDGMEVLYRQGGFGWNFIRGMLVILCWMGFLAAIGLAASSFLSFPVAAFVSIAILIVGFSSGTLSQVVDQGGIGGINHETGRKDSASGLDYVAIPLAKGILGVINLVKEFSPVSFLSTGRSITVGILFQALTQIVLLMGGLFAAFGIWAFYRSELATAQGNQ
ncbi:ABC transporter permease [bacterium]|nr:ABC transporter permease [bacterium]